MLASFDAAAMREQRSLCGNPRLDGWLHFFETAEMYPFAVVVDVSRPVFLVLLEAHTPNP